MRPYVTVSAASAVIISITLSSCSYLESHRASLGHDSTYEYQQVGRVEFYGPFPMQLLQANRAWFFKPEDAAIAQESTQPVLQQPIIAQNGTVIYPPLQPGRMRTVRIAHSVSGFVTQEPPPSWTGNVIHEYTNVPWAGSEAARYENSYRYQQGEVQVKTDRPAGLRNSNDGPDAWGHK